MSWQDSVPHKSCHALKEWAIVCAAIQQGRQQLLFRTGGIDETTDGFRLKQNAFWLYPTKFHQSSEMVTPEYAEEISSQEAFLQEGSDGLIPFRLFCQVAAIHYVDDFSRLELLRPFHVLNDGVLRTRFDYRKPGLFVIVIAPAVLPEPHAIPHQARYDGCMSWVELDAPLTTTELRPVVDWGSTQGTLLAVSALLKDQ